MKERYKHRKAPVPPIYWLLDKFIGSKIEKRPGIHVSGGENLLGVEGAALVAYMHRDTRDINFLGHAAMKVGGIHMRWLAKDNVFEEIAGIKPDEKPRLKQVVVKNFARAVLTLGGTRTIDRSKNLDSGTEEYIRRTVKGDGIIAWSPEGHRYVEDGYWLDPEHFKDQISMTAQQYGIPILPAAVIGLLEGDPEGPVVVRFGTPFQVDSLENLNSADPDKKRDATKEALRRRRIIMPALIGLMQETVDDAIGVRKELLELAVNGDLSDISHYLPAELGS